MRYLFVIVLMLCFAFSGKTQELEATDSLTLLKVNVVDEEGKPMEGETLTFTNLETKIEYSGVSNSEGKFDILIPEGGNYEVIVKSFGDANQKNQFQLPSPEGPLVTTYTMKTKRTSSFMLGVQYKVNSAEIEASTYQYIDQLFDYMEGKKGVKIEIGGHTDSDGSDEDNMKLSQARAESVRSYLIEKGADPEKIIAKGYGESSPIATNDTPEGKQKNRRTEVKILSN